MNTDKHRLRNILVPMLLRGNQWVCLRAVVDGESGLHSHAGAWEREL